MIALQGRLLCFLNAAVRKLASIKDMHEKDWLHSVNTNLNASFFLLKYLTPSLESSEDGRVIIMGSHAGEHYFDKGAAYCATKAALKALSEVYIQETRDNGIRTTLINAGAIKNRPKTHDDKKIEPEKLAAFIYEIAQASGNLLIVFGDHINDIKMFKIAHQCIAVQNADERLKKHAHKVIGTNMEDSVANYLEAMYRPQ